MFIRKIVHGMLDKKSVGGGGGHNIYRVIFGIHVDVNESSLSYSQFDEGVSDAC